MTNLFLNNLGEIEDPPDEYRSFFLEEHGRPWEVRLNVYHC